MAEALLDKVLGKLAKEEGEKAYEVLETYKGTDLEYKEYEPLFKCAGEAAAKQKKKGFFVLCDGYVTMSDGTGIVHIAPAFGRGRQPRGTEIRPAFRTVRGRTGQYDRRDRLRRRVCKESGSHDP